MARVISKSRDPFFRRKVQNEIKQYRAERYFRISPRRIFHSEFFKSLEILFLIYFTRLYASTRYTAC